MNWNILLASGKKIKRDSISSVNESRLGFKVKWVICLNKGEPSSKSKYNTQVLVKSTVKEKIEVVVL